MRIFSKVMGCIALVFVVIASQAFMSHAEAENDESALVLQPAHPTENEITAPDEELPELPPPRNRQARPRDRRTDSVSARPVNRPFMRPVAADGSIIENGRLPAPAEPIPAPSADGQMVYPVHDIEYDTDRGARRLYAASDGVIETVMITENPADGCLYEIPLCLPACCVGAPTIESRFGLLGRGVVEYCWPCGFEAEVKFRLRGDVKVEYDG